MADPTIRVAITSDTSDLDAGLRTSQSKLAGFGKAIGTAAVAAGSALAVGLGALGKVSVEAASDAQQSLGATEKVFGRFADTVKRTSKEAANQFGLSANEYRENANILGALLGNQGVEQDKLAGKTKNLIGTAADLAATFGGPTSDAVSALAGAFKGEFDPLEKYGISIKQAAVNTEAYALAGVETKAAFDELSTAEQARYKQLAANNLLTEQAAKTEGAFADESNTLANQQQKLAAQWDDLKVKIGSALLPAITNLVSAVNTKLFPVFNDLADKYLPDVRRALNDWTKDFDPEATFDKIADAVEGIDWGTIASDLGDLGDSLKDLGPALGEISTETVGDTMDVFGTAVGFAAENVDLLEAALPYLVTGFAALKAVQLLNNIAGKNSIIGLGLQLAATKKLTTATQELAIATGELKAVQGTTTTSINNGAAAASNAKGKFSGLKGVTRGLAGAAGLGLLVSGMGDVVDEGPSVENTLTNVVGGAMTGLAVGGPIGALIGGVAGGGLTALVGMFGGTKDAAKETRLELLKTEGFEQAKNDADELRVALDGVVNAYGRVPRAAVEASFFGEEGQLDKDIQLLRDAGVSMSTIVSATMGQADAQKIVRKALNDNVTSAQSFADQAKVMWDDAKDGVIEYRNEQGVLVSQHLSTEQQEIYKQAWEDAEGGVEDAQAALATFNERIGQNTQAIRDHRKEIRELARSLGLTVDQYKAFPKEVRTEIEAEGLPQTGADARRLIRNYKGLQNFKSIKAIISAPGVKLTREEVKKLAKQYDLTPKQLTTLFKVEGLNKAKRQAGEVKDAIKGADNVKPDFTDAKQAVVDFATEGRTKAVDAGKKIGAGLREGTRTAKPDLDPFRRGFHSNVRTMEGTARSGGHDIGSALKEGTLAGVGGLTGQLSTAVASAVNAAVAAGKLAADANSPSKKMMQLGRDIGTGLVIGLDSTSPELARAGARSVSALSVGMADSRAYRYSAAGPSVGTGGTQRAAAPVPTQIVPKTTPVKVFLDGEEISERIAIRVGERFSSTGPGRRRP